MFMVNAISLGAESKVSAASINVKRFSIDPFIGGWERSKPTLAKDSLKLMNTNLLRGLSVLTLLKYI